MVGGWSNAKLAEQGSWRPEQNENVAMDIKELFNYRNGELFWKASRKGAPKGKPAGYLGHNGYWFIKYDYKLHPRARLVWYWHHGRWPSKFIDHINGDPLDDRIENIREVTETQNQYNLRKHKDNTSGFKGVSYYKHRSHLSTPWAARIKVKNKQKHLGFFATREEADEAYQNAADEHHGEFAYHRRTPK